MAIEAVTLAIERAINGRPPAERQAVWTDRTRPFVTILQSWLRANLATLSPRARTAIAIHYML